jgi:hypothetical protein
MRAEGGKLRKLKILVATLVMALLLATPAFAQSLGASATLLDTDVEVFGIEAHAHLLNTNVSVVGATVGD